MTFDPKKWLDSLCLEEDLRAEWMLNKHQILYMDEPICDIVGTDLMYGGSYKVRIPLDKKSRCRGVIIDLCRNARMLRTKRALFDTLSHGIAEICGAIGAEYHEPVEKDSFSESYTTPDKAYSNFPGGKPAYSSAFFVSKDASSRVFFSIENVNINDMLLLVPHLRLVQTQAQSIVNSLKAGKENK